MSAGKLVIVCDPKCSLHPDLIGSEKAEALKALREAGKGQTLFMRLGAEVLGRPISHGTAQRHLKHYKDAASTSDAEQMPDTSRKATNLEILDRIIQRGFANSGNWKPSIKDTLDAMRLHVQMTGNTGDDELLKLMDEAEDPTENPEAIASAEERSEALPEPAL